jgi:IclR family mhp operon transcriptional activator
LSVISCNSGIKASEIAELLELARPTVYRLLETLEEDGYVVRSASDNRFRVARQVMSLCVGYDAANSMSQVTGPLLVELSQRFIWPFDMSVRHEAMMVVQESTHPRSPLAGDRGVIGRKLPMLRTAAGRSYLAHCAKEIREQALDEIKRAADPEDLYFLRPSALERMLGETVERGYGVRYSESYNPNTSSIAVPIFAGQTLVGSMAVIWITKALTLAEGVDQFVVTMRGAAQRISRQHERLHSGA